MFSEKSTSPHPQIWFQSETKKIPEMSGHVGNVSKLFLKLLQEALLVVVRNATFHQSRKESSYAVTRPYHKAILCQSLGQLDLLLPNQGSKHELILRFIILDIFNCSIIQSINIHNNMSIGLPIRDRVQRSMSKKKEIHCKGGRGGSKPLFIPRETLIFLF